VSTGGWVRTTGYAAFQSFTEARGTGSLGRIPAIQWQIPEQFTWIASVLSVNSGISAGTASNIPVYDTWCGNRAAC